ncbi:divalent metal cation transporter [Patescibacteria group bacterium]|nr:divalent metal cation transporter [Patescibacteria group bacterium]
MWRHFLKPIKRFRRSYLPGIVTASADDDPSSIATYSVVGATTGFSQLWLLLVSTPLLIAIHQMTARIGNVTKKGLITLIKEKFGRRIAFTCVVVLLAANLLSLAADIIGMAAGFQLLTGENYIYFIVPLIIFVWYIIVFDSYKKIAQYFFWFAGIMLAYILAGVLAKPDWGLVFKSIVVPPIKFNVIYFMAALGLIGTSFSPYAFFWQTEEEIEEGRGSRQVNQAGRSVILGFIYSGLVAFFVVVASASVILKTDINILTVKDIAQALAPVAGPWATKLFGLGLIGSGILAIPILAASSAYGVAEFFKWPQGLNQKPSRAKGFYGLITFGFVFCLAALLFDLNPIKAMFFSQVLVGAMTPIIIFFILRLAGSAKIMGDFCCPRWNIVGGWLAFILLTLGDIFLLYYLFRV